jgi:hypothetical protein
LFYCAKFLCPLVTLPTKTVEFISKSLFAQSNRSHATVLGLIAKQQRNMLSVQRQLDGARTLPQILLVPTEREHLPEHLVPHRLSLQSSPVTYLLVLNAVFFLVETYHRFNKIVDL